MKISATDECRALFSRRFCNDVWDGICVEHRTYYYAELAANASLRLRRPTVAELLGLHMSRASPKRDVNLFRPCLGRAAPFEGAVHDRVHLIEPPACSGSAPRAHDAARS